MIRENIIGKGVHILEGEKLDTSKVYCVVEVKPWDGKDWCDHVIVQLGNDKRELREVDIVIAPDYSLPEERMIQKYLNDNGIWTEVAGDKSRIVVSIDWGDWKHSHIWCKNLMKYLGYTQSNEIVTEENGSDCYSADHYFYRKRD